MTSNYTVYLVECSDRSLYCGITRDLKRRIVRHNQGTASKYTRARLPIVLRVSASGFTKSEALQIEYRIKQLPANEKESYLMGQNGPFRAFKEHK
jgi:putative endonuclease